MDLILARRYVDLANFDPNRWALVAPGGDFAPLFIMAGELGPTFTPRRIATEPAFGSVSLTTLEFRAE